MGRSKDIASGSKFVDTTGDTMTGALTGTSAGFTGDVNIGNNDASNPVSKLRLGATLYGAADIVPVSTGHKIGLDFKTDSTGDTTIDPVTRMSISNEGYVTKPNQPMFHAWCTDGANGAVSGNSSPTNFYVSLNVGSHFSSGTFTAPIDGKYRFYYAILSGTSGGYGLIQFTVNNSGSFGGGINSNYGQIYNYAQANDKCLTRELLVDLSANDYVKLQVHSYNNFYWSGGYSYFGGHLLG